MKSYGNPCGIFSYDTNEAMRVFCIIEMFLALFHLVVALMRIPVLEHSLDGYYASEEGDYTYGAEKVWVVVTGFFMVFLIAQSILAFFLYFMGWKKKNGIVCLVWVVCAAFNVLLSWGLLIFYLTDTEGLGSGWDYYMLYLLYPIYGIWIVVAFMLEIIGFKCRSKGNPNSSPSTVRPVPSKSNRDTHV